MTADARLRAVQSCPLCNLTPELVAERFTTKRMPLPKTKPGGPVHAAYQQLKKDTPECGPEAADFVRVYWQQHRHGPTWREVGTHLGWFRSRRKDIVGHLAYQYGIGRLIRNEWLVTDGLPWGLWPGKARR
ncbi:hypothetical protein EF910_32080 [Streptomyces sp. WAC07149]|uniref:hypothetical protein n=1 Tax=Streptomyces sp. WAC07149 TaxID=2487425 RepID=UPI000F7724AE|nr:hypothetical protein [Streptomyces sp. WAC07149]RST00375.1 hypothetical protein EF910_32080 [Streptomyces sp. WAC07149]